MNDIIIEPASLKDLDRILDWRMRVLKEVFALDPEGQYESLIESNREFYRRTLADGSHRMLWVKKTDGSIAGCGDLCFQEEMPSPANPSGHCAYVMNVYIDPAQRRKGYASRLVRSLIEEAKKHGAQKITLEASDDGRPVYLKEGFIDEEGMMIYQPESEDRNE